LRLLPLVHSKRNTFKELALSRYQEAAKVFSVLPDFENILIQTPVKCNLPGKEITLAHASPGLAKSPGVPADNIT
jgi:hypothetical protein